MNKGGFSWKTFFGITTAKRNFARKTGIPTSRTGLEQKSQPPAPKDAGLEEP